MKKINESFVCLGCGKSVNPAQKTCRNHCPYCFASQHVDGDIPGDRTALAICGGKMLPFEYEIRNGTLKIHFRCTLCGKKHWNKSLDDDNRSELDHAISLGKRHFENSLQIFDKKRN